MIQRLLVLVLLCSALGSAPADAFIKSRVTTIDPAGRIHRIYRSDFPPFVYRRVTTGVTATFGWYPYGVYKYVPVYGHSYWRNFGYQPRFSKFAAIAYSAKTGNRGYSYRASTRWAGERIAKLQCGAKDCETVVWVQGGCAAVAKSQAGQEFAWAIDSTLWSAQRWAMIGCRRSGAKDCRMLSRTCSNW